MKIATFNVNGVKTRLAHLLRWLEKEQPDVACLQELKSLDEGFPAEAIRAAGYGALWKGQRSWNGVAILARGQDPVEIRRELPGDDADAQSRYLEAAIDGLVVGCLYLPNGNPQPGPKFEYKLAWFERLIAHAATLVDSPHPVVLCGDYNVVPTDFDIYNPRSWRKDALLQPESRACWERLLAQGWTDAIRHLHPEEPIYTFWDYFRQHWQRNSGLRIDHLLLNRRVAPGLRSAGVDTWVRGEEKASDHAPTWIEIELPKAAAKSRGETLSKQISYCLSRIRLPLGLTDRGFIPLRPRRGAQGWETGSNTTTQCCWKPCRTRSCTSCPPPSGRNCSSAPAARTSISRNAS